ncbi:MAG: S9 family peptidase [Myxococcales bacterium]
MPAAARSLPLALWGALSMTVPPPAQGAPPPRPAMKPQARGNDLAFLETLTQTRGFRLGLPGTVQLTPDGGTVLFLRGLARSPELRLHAFDVKTGAVRELITPDQILGGKAEVLSDAEKAQRERMRVSVRGFTSYDLSHDGTQVLVSLSGRAYVVPLAGGSAREVAGPGAQGEPIFDARLSPDGARVSFVRGGELWVAPSAGGIPHQLTHGATAARTHAQAEFIAQEELGRFRGYWWSPDSKSLLYEEADAGFVEQLYLADPADEFKPPQQQAYPRPGKPNVKLAFGIVPAAGGETRWLEYDRARFEYVARVDWEENAQPTLLLLTRDQKDLSLVAADPATGKTRELLCEHDDAWLNVDSPRAGGGRDYRWLPDGSGFLWTTEARGAWQLELRGKDGALLRELTPVDFGLAGLDAIDARAGTALVSRAAEPFDAQVWEVPLKGGPPRALTQGPARHDAVFARESRAHALTELPRQGPPTVRVVRADGSTAGVLPSVAEKAPFSVNLSLSKVGAEGFWTATIKPHDFDPAKKYPVIVQVYGGPHARTVHATDTAYVTAQWIADHGYIVVSADGRGTPGRGRAWERAIRDRFAEVPLADQVAALRALAQREPSMDLARVGIMGHSFGGFMSALSVMRRPDVFRAGVAGAPVVDWRNYDTAYTERYLGVPPPAGPSAAYEANGLLPYAAGLERPLLILHGTADDNVHFSETLLLTDALFRAGRPFELLPMRGQTHMFYEPQMMVRYWERVFGFFEAHLGTPAAHPG